MIVNRRAGRFVHQVALYERMLACLRARYPDIEVLPTERRGHATELAALAIGAGASLILAAGGDGTINETVNGMLGSAAPLGVLAAGTANVLACEVGLPRDPLECAAMMGNLVPRRIALGRLTAAEGSQRHFVLMAGAGLDAMVLSRVSQRIKNATGKLAYYIAGLSLLDGKTPPVRVHVGERHHTTLFALIARTRNYGGDLTIAAGASLLKDSFQVVTFAGGTWRYPFYLTGALLGHATRFPGVTNIETTRVMVRNVQPGAPVYTQVDGELFGHAPATVETVPDALTLLMPKTYLERRRK